MKSAKPRWFEPGTVLLLTSRTLEGRFYLVPDRPEVNATIIGAVARGQRAHAVDIHGVAFLSNHFHMVVTGDNPEQIAAFMRSVKSNLTRRINRIRGRSGTLWHRRYDLERIEPGYDSHLRSLAYVVAHGAKEGLVDRPGMWPGVTSARELLDGDEPAAGVWERRTAMARTTKRVVRRNPDRFRVAEQIQLSPLPGMSSMAPDERRGELRAAVDAVVSERDPQKRPSMSAEEARKRAENTDWRTTIGAPPARRRCRPNVEGSWEGESLREAFEFVVAKYRAASDAHRAGLDCEYPSWTIPAWLRMGEERGAVFARVNRELQTQWARRSKTGVRGFGRDPP